MTNQKSTLLLVSNDKQLSEAVDEFMNQELVAVDTESNSLYVYRERVCLIQFSIPGKDYLVDPFKIGNMDLLGNLFKSKKIEKVFHAAEYDLLVLKRDFGYEFNNLFDTMIAAKILGYKRVGLGSLVELFYKKKLAKKYQTANWGRRPLPQEMLDYARLDTIYRKRLRDHLKKDLQKNKKWELAIEDFTRLARVNGNTPEPQTVNIWRINGANRFTLREAAVMQRLATYRNKKARQINKPLFKILGDRTLVEIIKKLPKNNEELSRIEGMSPNQINRHGRQILSAIAAGKNDPGLERPPRERRKNIEIKRLEVLKEWRKYQAQKMGVESDVVLPKEILHRLIEINRVSKKAIKKMMEDVPWRYENFGDNIFQNLVALENKRNNK